MKAPFQVHWQAPFPANVCGSGCKALRWRLQSFALAIAKLCVGGCNALRWWMQCFALVDAMLCPRPMSHYTVTCRAWATLFGKPVCPSMRHSVKSRLNRMTFHKQESVS